jgi:hypothetical protein
MSQNEEHEGQERQDEETNRLIGEAVHLSEKANEFLNSDLASYIKNNAESLALDAQDKLLVVDPTNIKEIVRLQSAIKGYRFYEQCLYEVVAAGDSAYQMYLEQRRMDEEG